MGLGGGIEGRDDHETSSSRSSHAESSWRLKELTEGAVTIGVRGLFQYIETRIEKDDFLQRTLKG